jgi:hypothetical protein
MVESLGFRSVRTDAFDATLAACRDVPHLEAIHVEPDPAWFRTSGLVKSDYRCPEGNACEIIGADRQVG